MVERERETETEGKPQTGFCKHLCHSCSFAFAFLHVCVKGMSTANMSIWRAYPSSFTSSWLYLLYFTHIFLPCLPDAAQLYQQYNEAAQNFEILRQARSDVTTISEDTTPSPAPSPLPARRPLPPLPSAQPPHRLSITSVQSLPLPEPPKTEGRPSSPRLSISLSQSSTLWRELPGVRNSSELEELTEAQRRLQEVNEYI